MLNGITLTDIVLFEFIVALALLAGILLLVLHRERRAHRRLRAQLQRMRSTIRVGATPQPDSGEFFGSDDNDDPVARHLYECQQAARKRYHAITQQRVPRLAPDQPFNAKIAALRYLYSSAEMEVHQRGKSGRHSWNLLERKLQEIARWVVERKEARNDKHLRNQVRLLQQRVQALKPYEQDCHRLEQRLALAKDKLEQLQAHQDQSQSTIDHLRRSNYTLQLAQQPTPNGYIPRDGDRTVGEATFGGKRARQASMAVPHFSGNIEQLSAQYRDLNTELTTGLRRLARQQKPAGSEQLEQWVQRLDAELEKSQAYIETLKQRLAERQPNAHPEPEVAHAQAPFAPTEPASLGEIRETLHIIHTNVADKRAQISGDSESTPRSEPSRRDYTLDELWHLRNNNRQQRALIVGLEQQLSTLRDTIDTTEDEELREAQIQEMLRLEQLVRECEYCITALESEVDFLYNQLQDQLQDKDREHAQPDDPALAAPETAPDETADSAEPVEAIVNQLGLDLLQAHAPEDVASALVDAIKSSGLILGFYLHCKLGEAEFYRRNQFTEAEQDLLKQTTIAAPFAYLNEGILFASNHLHMLLKGAPDEPQLLARTERFLTRLVDLCSARLHYLELGNEIIRTDRVLNEWSQDTREHLMALEIRYAHQAEDLLRQLEILREELQQLTGTLELSTNAQAALGNAISECRHRIEQRLGGDDSIVQLCAQLLAQLDTLPRPSR